ncbi:carboxylic ester hydrolase [Sphaerisporangium rufum]|uniref:Carboxylic ester hydrolase n=1 Tax=Sphaerisporangium rufum TaxID=1381558 RepID=A0A919QW33_9ACTN|nr:carboxylesterase family protein [Sphaerisporangium rufum]GII75154.1 carboxylic ester hydrolase [Sphaerisporangium rufum]
MSTAARARVTGGLLRGHDESGAVTFRGVRYAAPARRFTPPEPVEHWSGEQDARDHGPPAAQRPGRMAWVPGLALDAARSREDCLTLTVWTPGCDGERRPVLVFLHGGAFVSGSGAQAMYDGAALARAHGLVVVTVNYRLGFLGFGHHDATPANLGLRDQIAALRWVRANAAAFGGNPDRVTLAGHSAGGTSVLALMTCPEARGLFARAALLSAVPYGFATPAEAADQAAAVRRALGRGAGLGSVPLRALLAAQDVAMSGRRLVAGVLPVAPVVDGSLLPRHPVEAVRAGAAGRIPLLVSTTTEEMRLYAAAGTVPPAEVAARTREVFVDPADEVARAHHGPVTRVRYARPSPFTRHGARLGACHLADVPFHLGTFADARVAPLAGTGPAVETFGRAVTAAFAAFCRGDETTGFSRLAEPDIGGEEWHSRAR